MPQGRKDRPEDARTDHMHVKVEMKSEMKEEDDQPHVKLSSLLSLQRFPIERLKAPYSSVVVASTLWLCGITMMIAQI